MFILPLKMSLIIMIKDKDFFKTIFIELKNSVNDNLVYEPFLRCHQIVEEKYIELFCIIKVGYHITLRQCIDC